MTNASDHASCFNGLRSPHDISCILLKIQLKDKWIKKKKKKKKLTIN